MRKIVLAIFAVLALGVLQCGDESSGNDKSSLLLLFSQGSTSPTFVNTPEANPLYDASNQGIYKGVLTGSSGSFKIDIGNDGGSGKKLYLTFNGVNLTIDGSVSGTGPYTYTFTQSGYTLTVVIQANGTVNSATFDYPSGSAIVSIIKEKSDVLVKSFEGTYSITYGPPVNTTDTGVFNVTVSGSNASGSCRSDIPPNSQLSSNSGTFSSNTITFIWTNDVAPGDGHTYTIRQTAAATISNDTLSGTVEIRIIAVDGTPTDQLITTGTWQGSRKL